MGRKTGVEYINVHIRFEGGKTLCICKKSCKMCSRPCPEDVVEWDRYRDWEETYKTDRYGRRNC